MRALAVTTAAALAMFGGVTAANAAPGDSSNATGTFLGGSILDLIDLSAVADLEGAAATNDGTPPTVTDFNTLDLSVLGGVVTVTAPGGVQIPLDIADLGVLGQYASAAPDGTSVGASGAVGSDGVIGVGPVPGSPPGPLSVSLSGAVDSLGLGPVGDLVEQIADLDLSVGAVSAQASLTGATGITRTYDIASADLTFQSPTVAALSDVVATDVVDTVDAAVGTLNATVAGLLGVVSSLGLVTADLAIDTSSLTAFVNDQFTGVLTDPAYPGVSIDLSTGTITLDLEAIHGLNGLGVGEELLDGDTVQAVQDAVIGLLNGFVDDFIGEASTATDPATGLLGAIEGLSVTGDATLLGLTILTVDSTVGALLDGDITGVSLLGLGLGLPGGVQALVAGLLSTLTSLLGDVAGAVEAALAPVNDLLLPALDAVLPAVASLTVHNQSDTGGVYSETALILTVLPLLGLDAVTLEFANATVGPNAVDANADVAITAPTPDQVFSVPGPDDVADVTVSGTGEPGATVTVSMPGQTDQTATVSDPGGTWSATFPDLAIGDYTATATQDVDGTVATVDFSVAEAPDVEILSPTPGEEFSVVGPDDTVDVPVSGTGLAGAEVEVDVDGVVQTVTVDDDGTWETTVDGLGVGDYTATATQDVDGSTDTVDFAVVEAGDVTIDTPADGEEIVVDGPTDLADVIVGGTGAGNATVTVAIPGFGIQTAVVDGVTGEWEVTFPGLPVGDYTATATQDVDGSTASVDFSVIVAEDVVITEPGEGDVILVPDATDLADVTVSGTGQDGATVEVTIPGEDAPAAVTVVDGVWSVEFPGLAVGEYTATAAQSDGSTDTVTFSVASATDVAITAPTPGQVFTVADDDDTTDVTVTGTGQDGETVEVTLGTTTQEAVVTDGTWTTTFTDLPVGEYGATAVQLFDDSSDSVDFSIVATPDVEIDAPATGEQIIADDATSTATVAVSGAGAEGATITVSIPGQPDQSAVVTDGAWSVEFPGLGLGGYTATAVQDADQSVDSVTFAVVAADDIVITAPQQDERLLVADPGDVRDVIVRGLGEPGLDIEVTIPGLGAEVTTVTPFGTWAVTFADVAEGDHTATAVQEDGSTDAVDFTVAAAADLDILTPADGAVFPVAGPDSTQDVTVSGTGEPLEEVTVTLDSGAELDTTVLPDGTWTVTFEDLPVGDDTATAVQAIDESTDAVDFTIEAIADVDILVPTAGTEFVVDGADGTAEVTVSGTGYTGDSVTVEIPGLEPLTSPVTAGAWSVTFPAAPVGEHTATATQAGDGSTDSVDFTVRAAADVTIDEPADGDTITVPDEGDTTAVTVTGTGEPGRTVEVTIPGLPPVETEVDDEGAWEVEVPGVPEGEHVITATQDGSSTSVTISVESADDVVIESPADGEVIPAAGDTVDVIVSGIGQPQAVVTVELDGDGEGAQTATVGDDGTWSTTFEGVPVGEHSATAMQDVDGSTSTVDFTVEDIADVTIAEPTDGQVFPVDGPADTAEVVVSGTGYDGETVTVTIPGLEPQSATVAEGAWSVTFPAVPVGEHTATAVQTGDESTDAVAFAVEDRADVTITVPVDGDTIVVPDEGDTVDVPVCGEGSPGSTVTVTVGELPAQQTEVGEDGVWCLTVPEVPEGEHEITADQDDGSSTTIVVEVVAADDVTITGPTPGQEFGVPGPDDTAEVPVTGTGQPGETITVVLDGEETQEATVGDDGTWEVVFEEVPIGEHTVVATQEVDGSTATVDFSVADVVVPVAIDSPAPGTQLTVPSPGDVIPLGVSGTGEPGAQIEVMIGGLEGMQTATVGDDGTWSVEFEGIGVGGWEITAMQDVDESTATTNVVVMVGAPDTSKARADVTEQRIVRSSTAMQTVVLTGFQPGETVSATVNSTPFELTPVTADGFGNARLTFAVGPDFELGAHRVEVRGSITGELPAERENTAFTVVAAAAGAGGLPATGGDAGGLFLAGGAGLALILAGAALWVLRRRRTATE